MPFINPEVLAYARVQARYVIARHVGSYLFSNGFDAAEVPGTPYNTPVIGSLGADGLVLFLSEPVSPGQIVIGPLNNLSNEGGIKATVDIVDVSTPLDPSPTLLPVKARWYYGNYNLSTVFPTGSYASVEPKKAISIKFYLQDGSDYTGPCIFDIVVFRNPMTRYKPPVIYGVQPNVVVYPPP